jgi:excisionase family DNA binding protein
MKANSETVSAESIKKTRQRQLTESRRELFARLENPEVTLEEAALLLNLCRATVRRYSDAGVLPSHRTAGGQRRYYFQDIKKFLLQKQQQKKKR